MIPEDLIGQIESDLFWFVLVRVTSWIGFRLSGQKERSTKSHELNTKLVTKPIDFEASIPT